MAPLRGWAPKGTRLRGFAPHGHWRTMTFSARCVTTVSQLPACERPTVQQKAEDVPLLGLRAPDGGANGKDRDGYRQDPTEDGSVEHDAQSTVDGREGKPRASSRIWNLLVRAQRSTLGAQEGLWIGGNQGLAPLPAKTIAPAILDAQVAAVMRALVDRAAEHAGTVMPGFERQFNAENGEEHLRRHFADVERIDTEVVAIVDDRETLVGYQRSLSYETPPVPHDVPLPFRVHGRTTIFVATR